MFPICASGEAFAEQRQNVNASEKSFTFPQHSEGNGTRREAERNSCVSSVQMWNRFEMQNDLPGYHNYHFNQISRRLIQSCLPLLLSECKRQTLQITFFQWRKPYYKFGKVAQAAPANGVREFFFLLFCFSRGLIYFKLHFSSAFQNNKQKIFRSVVCLCLGGGFVGPVRNRWLVRFDYFLRRCTRSEGEAKLFLNHFCCFHQNAHEAAIWEPSRQGL